MKRERIAFSFGDSPLEPKKVNEQKWAMLVDWIGPA